MRCLLPLLAAAALLPAPASACRVAAAQRPLLHERLPPLPRGAIAAEVEIVTDVRAPARPELEARIIRMRRGHYRGTRLRIDRTVVSSCDSIPYPGMRGIVAGWVVSQSGDLLVVAAIHAPSALERQQQRVARRGGRP